MNKKFLIPVLSAVLLAGSVVGVSVVSASQNGNFGDHSALTQRLVERFGLNETEVTQFFE